VLCEGIVGARVVRLMGTETYNFWHSPKVALRNARKENAAPFCTDGNARHINVRRSYSDINAVYCGTQGGPENSTKFIMPC